jgi:precorrin-2 dehydrogenase/sirohydrochlorin ferrochelatase
VQFPINLNLMGRAVLVVGGGRIALRKVEQLLVAGARITVLAPEHVAGFADLPVELVARRYESGDVAGYRLVITATGDRVVDQQIHDEADALGIWINSADDPDRCTFTLPAVLRRGPVMVTVSTGGASPALSSWLRRRLEDEIGPEFVEVVSELAMERARIHSLGLSTEDVDWQPIIDDVVRRHGVRIGAHRAEVVAS